MIDQNHELIEPLLDVNLRHRLNVAYLGLRAFLPPKNNNLKVVIYGQGRTGSTVLENLICSTGYFEERGEIIRPYRRLLKDPVNFVNGFSNHYHRGNFIFHVKIYQLEEGDFKIADPAKFLKKLSDQGWKIIFLHRENILRQCISKEIANQRNVYHHRKDEKLEESFKLDMESLKEQILLRKEFLKKERKHLEGLEYEEVSYEKDLLDASRHQETVDRLLKFLGFDQKPVSTKLRRTSKKPLSEQISNYDEMLNMLKTNHWEHFLEDNAYS